MGKLTLVVLVVLAVVGVIGIVLGLYWLFWMLWTWVLLQIWPDGPEAIVRPGYWLFVGALVILSAIGSVLFKSPKS